MKKFLLLAVAICCTVIASATKTITWNYNMIKSIYYVGVESTDRFYPVGSKDGITLIVPLDYDDHPELKNCTWIGSKTLFGDYNSLYFCSTAGRITSITITCSNTSGALRDPEEYGWTTTKTSATWTGAPSNGVMMPLRGDGGAEGFKDITQITFTVEDEIFFVIKNLNEGDMVNGKIGSSYEAKEGQKIVYKPVNADQITRVQTDNFGVSYDHIILTDNGDGTWTLPSMPAYDIRFYRIETGRYCIDNIPIDWLVNWKTKNYKFLSEGWFIAGQGDEVIFDPKNIIPEGKKIKNIKVVDESQANSIILTDNGDGTWTLPSVPAYHVNLFVEYEDDVTPGTKYTISNIPYGWKVDEATTSGTIKALKDQLIEFTPTNIPAGKKIKSVKVVDETQTNSISLTGKGNSTWTLASMPGYNVNMVVEYEDDDQFLTGRFSVAADKQVTFSPGNLQYKASTSTWAFAENQYDFVGSDNANISSTYDGWIDLFGWGTSGYNDKQPYMTSEGDGQYGDGTNDLTDTNYDWGAYASISNGGNMDWRTLSAAEWDYLLQTRDGAASKHGNATVAGNKGLVLLPDKWQLPEGLSFTADPTDWTTNTYTAEQWAEMEAVGAVFLPASGRRVDGSIYNITSNCRGYYWTVSASGEDKALFLDFREKQVAQTSPQYRSYGYAVRLASDVIIKTVSNPTITLSETTFVYDGKAKTPTVTVMDGATVIPASEYSVGYSNNVNAGTATVTITDNEDGDYIVSGSTTFSITAKTVSSPTVTLEKTYYFYDGTAKTPTVTVKDGETVIPASEYTIGYSNNTNVGTATVTITDKDGGNYTVSGSATFEIGLKGDANGDNKVDAADIVEMVNETKGQTSAKFKKNNADIDGNGQITTADINEVAKIILAGKDS